MTFAVAATALPHTLQTIILKLNLEESHKKRLRANRKGKMVDDDKIEIQCSMNGTSCPTANSKGASSSKSGESSFLGTRLDQFEHQSRQRQRSQGHMSSRSQTRQSNLEIGLDKNLDPQLRLVDDDNDQ